MLTLQEGINLTVIHQILGGNPPTRQQSNFYCPAHDDRKNPSLSIKQEGNQILVHCFAGCTFESIRDALISKGIVKKLYKKERSYHSDFEITQKQPPKNTFPNLDKTQFTNEELESMTDNELLKIQLLREQGKNKENDPARISVQKTIEKIEAQSSKHKSKDFMQAKFQAYMRARGLNDEFLPAPRIFYIHHSERFYSRGLGIDPHFADNQHWNLLLIPFYEPLSTEIMGFQTIFIDPKTNKKAHLNSYPKSKKFIGKIKNFITEIRHLETWQLRTAKQIELCEGFENAVARQAAHLTKSIEKRRNNKSLDGTEDDEIPLVLAVHSFNNFMIKNIQKYETRKLVLAFDNDLIGKNEEQQRRIKEKQVDIFIFYKELFDKKRNFEIKVIQPKKQKDFLDMYTKKKGCKVSQPNNPHDLEKTRSTTLKKGLKT